MKVVKVLRVDAMESEDMVERAQGNAAGRASALAARVAVRGKAGGCIHTPGEEAAPGHMRGGGDARGGVQAATAAACCAAMAAITCATAAVSFLA
ncbi:hypothetical protein GmRootA79_26600 [Acidovorax sp. A79]